MALIALVVRLHSKVERDFSNLSVKPKRVGIKAKKDVSYRHKRIAFSIASRERHPAQHSCTVPEPECS